MGNTSSGVWTDLVIGEPIPSTLRLSQLWTAIHPAVYKSTRKVTAFVREFADTDSDETRSFFENGIQVVKQLRHPNIVSFAASQQRPAELCLIVERVQPLEYVLDTLTPVEILAGARDILDALQFLHDVANISHNNICPSAVFVSSDGRWQLGSFECARRLSDNKHWVMSAFAKTIKETTFMPPEDQQLVKSDAPTYARDVYGFGKLIEYLAPYFESGLDDEQNAALHELVDELTNTEAGLRPAVSNILLDAISTDLCKITKFLKELPTASDGDKQTFFSTLAGRLRHLPQDVVARRLTKMLLSRYVLLEIGAVRFFLREFVTVQGSEDDISSEAGLLPLPLFQRYVVPELCRIFCVHETSVRLALLAHFDAYVTSMPINTLEKCVLPELLLGMKDEDDAIVAASLRAMADLVPLLGAVNVTGLSHQKYFVDGRPKHIRADYVVPSASQLATVRAAIQHQQKPLAVMSSTHNNSNEAVAASTLSTTTVSEASYSVTQQSNSDLSTATAPSSRASHEKLAERKQRLEEQRAKRLASKQNRLTAKKLVDQQRTAGGLERPNLAAIAADVMAGAPSSQEHQIDVFNDLDSKRTDDNSWDDDWQDDKQTKSKSKQREQPLVDGIAVKPTTISALVVNEHAKSQLESSNSTAEANRRRPSLDEQALGAEFDIFSLDFHSKEGGKAQKPADPDLELFADLEPKLKPYVDPVTGIATKEKEQSVTKAKEPVKTTVSARFALPNSDDAKVEGWGDGGWDDDDVD